MPGLLGVVLTMTMIMVTGLALTREREVGTMESLLATPAKPFEVMVGKIIPYIIVGYIPLTKTHFLRIVRGIMLKGNTTFQVWSQMWSMLIFMVVVVIIGAKVYRRNLD